MKDYTTALMTLMLSAFVFSAQAEQKLKQGHYEVHYNTFPSTFLSKEIANTYQIGRSKNRAIISISVIDTRKDPATASKAQVKVLAKNLINQKKPVKLQEIKEENDNAIYYLGSFAIANQEDVNFTLQVTPDGESESIEVKFSREFYTD